MKAPVLPAPSKKHPSLRAVVSILIGALAGLGVLIFALAIWFFAACANNPDCLKFG
jgi:hypothetical protein